MNYFKTSLISLALFMALQVNAHASLCLPCPTPAQITLNLCPAQGFCTGQVVNGSHTWNAISNPAVNRATTFNVSTPTPLPASLECTYSTTGASGQQIILKANANYHNCSINKKACPGAQIYCGF